MYHNQDLVCNFWKDNKEVTKVLEENWVVSYNKSTFLGLTRDELKVLRDNCKEMGVDFYANLTAMYFECDTKNVTDLEKRYINEMMMSWEFRGTSFPKVELKSYRKTNIFYKWQSACPEYKNTFTPSEFSQWLSEVERFRDNNETLSDSNSETITIRTDGRCIWKLSAEGGVKYINYNKEGEAFEVDLSEDWFPPKGYIPKDTNTKLQGYKEGEAVVVLAENSKDIPKEKRNTIIHLHIMLRDIFDQNNIKLKVSQGSSKKGYYNIFRFEGSYYFNDRVFKVHYDSNTIVSSIELNDDSNTLLLDIDAFFSNADMIVINVYGDRSNYYCPGYMGNLKYLAKHHRIINQDEVEAADNNIIAEFQRQCVKSDGDWFVTEDSPHHWKNMKTATSCECEIAPILPQHESLFTIQAVIDKLEKDGFNREDEYSNDFSTEYYFSNLTSLFRYRLRHSLIDNSISLTFSNNFADHEKIKELDIDNFLSNYN